MGELLYPDQDHLDRIRVLGVPGVLECCGPNGKQGVCDLGPAQRLRIRHRARELHDTALEPKVVRYLARGVHQSLAEDRLLNAVPAVTEAGLAPLEDHAVRCERGLDDCVVGEGLRQLAEGTP